MKILLHACEVKYAGTPAYYMSGYEIRLFVAHIISYSPIEIKLKPNGKRIASSVKDIHGEKYFVFESPLEIDKLIEKITRTL